MHQAPRLFGPPQRPALDFEESTVASSRPKPVQANTPSIPASIPPSTDSALIQPPTPFLDPIPGIIPFGSLCLLVGPPKCGKTALLASWMVRWRDSLTICGRATNPPVALGIITTDHKWALNQGLWFARAGFPDIPHVSLRDDATLKWRTALKHGGPDKLLDECLHKLALPPGGLVVIDVAGVFISNHLNDYNEVLAGMGSMSQAIDRYQLTGLGIGHMGKQRADPKERYLRPHERILGSGAQIGFSDTTMYLLGPSDTGQPYHTFGWLPTHAPEGEFHFHQNSVTGLFEPYTGALEDMAALSPELIRVVDAFPPPPQTLPTGQLVPLIMAACAVSERTAYDRLEDLVLSGLITRARHGAFMRATGDKTPCSLQ